MRKLFAQYVSGEGNLLWDCEETIETASKFETYPELVAHCKMLQGETTVFDINRMGSILLENGKVKRVKGLWSNDDMDVDFLHSHWEGMTKNKYYVIVVSTQAYESAVTSKHVFESTCTNQYEMLDDFMFSTFGEDEIDVVHAGRYYNTKSTELAMKVEEVREVTPTDYDVLRKYLK